MFDLLPFLVILYLSCLWWQKRTEVLIKRFWARRWGLWNNERDWSRWSTSVRCYTTRSDTTWSWCWSLWLIDHTNTSTRTSIWRHITTSEKDGCVGLRECNKRLKATDWWIATLKNLNENWHAVHITAYKRHITDPFSELFTGLTEYCVVIRACIYRFYDVIAGLHCICEKVHHFDLFKL